MTARMTYHFIGIGGIGMSGLARILLSRDIRVTGSDIAIGPVVEALVKDGAVVYKGHAAEHVPEGAYVVYSSDIKADNPEFEAAGRLQCSLLHRADLLAALSNDGNSLAVAGTHGKTTTSSLLATVLVDAGLDPSFAVGGVLPAFQVNARAGKGEYFVLEADESDRSFLKYHPYGAIVTNIDNDHLSNYEENFDLLVDNFKTFMLQVKSSRHLFWCRDDVHLTRLNIPGQTYGFHPESKWRIISSEQDGFRTLFDLEHQGRLYSKIESSLIGQHNVLNAAAVFGLAITLGISEASIRQSIKDFKGVLRRCENKGSCDGIQFLDDYAHHPTEIQTTLDGIKKAVGANRLIAVFQPHRYSRTKDCLGSFGAAFKAADLIILTDIYAAGETAIPDVNSDLIQKEVEASSAVPCHLVPRSALAHYVSQLVNPTDVVVTLGAGDITKLSSEALVLLEKRKNGFV